MSGERFLTAVKQRDTLACMLALEGITDINARITDCSPLQWAVSQGATEVVKVLMGKGAKLVRLQNDKRTELHMAAGLRVPEIVELLLAYGADVNARDMYGATPIHYACSLGDVESAQMLIRHGADVNAKSNDGSSPLHSACHRRSTPECIQMLVAAGADIESKNEDGDTPFSCICSMGDRKRAFTFIEAGANVNVLIHAEVQVGVKMRFQEARTLSPLYRFTTLGLVPWVKMLVEAGAKNEAFVDMYGRTALDFATEKGLTKCAELLKDA